MTGRGSRSSTSPRSWSTRTSATRTPPIPQRRGRRGCRPLLRALLYRSELHSTTQEEETARALTHLRRTIELEGPQTIAAIILETIPCTAGIMLPTPEYLQGVRALCDESGIVYIADEVMAGFGRSGRGFAFEHFDIEPDLVTFAKGVNSGYVPLGGVAISRAIYDTFADDSYPGGLTYSGHPLAAAAAVATITAMES